MGKKLILMRHAKSSWDDPRQEDHARPLNPRGRRSARAMGDWLRRMGHVPDAVLSSDAQRTRETAALLGFEAVPQFTDRLYHAGASRMLEVLRGASGDCVLMIGHNPGIADFAGRIVAAAPAHPRFFDYPTCATLVAEVPQAEWDAVCFGSARVLEFAVPREVG
ncbi:MAG: histidine phosphatase family protein [Rhodobacteraceae bacterium]|nr:MAG: histidine phosphatase family protein [Paracoccaceae bacterium]